MRTLVALSLSMVLTAPARAWEQRWSGTAHSHRGASNGFALGLDPGAASFGFARLRGRYRCLGGSLPCLLGRADITVRHYGDGRVTATFANRAETKSCFLGGHLVRGAGEVGSVVAGDYECDQYVPAADADATVDQGTFRARRRR